MTNTQKQCLLAYLGYYTGAIDGIWGQQSRQATEAFQRDYQLTVDGVFGDATAKRIREVIADREQPIQQPQSVTETGGGENWWKDIKHFTRDEPFIACPCGKCGGFPVEPSEKLMRMADTVREHFDAPMIPTSTVRCQAHNDSLKGSVKNSYHVRGKAMDFVVSGHQASEVVSYVQTLGIHYTYAIDSSAVHMDVE
ncbi:MAG: D-Ala-D-Ala carboxypeptidase family metallohydrolase [Faecousia sp.]